MDTRIGRSGCRSHRRTSRATLARDIADSIKQHQAQGIARTIEEYTTTEETIKLVEELLAA